MSDKKPQCKVIVKNDTGEETAHITVDVPGKYKFEGLCPGSYEVEFFPFDGLEFISENPQQETVNACGCLAGEIVLADFKAIDIPCPSSNPWLNPAVAIPSITATILAMIRPSCAPNISSVSNVGNQLRVRRTPITRANRELRTPIQSSRNPIASSSQGLSERGRTCLIENFKSLADVPDFSRLPLSWIEENTGDEFVEGAIFLYENYDQARSIFEDCNVTLIDNLLADNTAFYGEEVSNESLIISNGESLIVSGDGVNIRNGPGLEFDVISQVSYGHVLQLDVATFVSFTEQKKVAIARNEDWIPIILSDGRQGYIYSLYADTLP